MEFKETKEKVLVLLVVALLAAFAFQTFQLAEIRNHHHFAVITVDELTGVRQRCESIISQCCK